MVFDIIRVSCLCWGFFEYQFIFGKIMFKDKKIVWFIYDYKMVFEIVKGEIKMIFFVIWVIIVDCIIEVGNIVYIYDQVLIYIGKYKFIVVGICFCWYVV